MSYIVQVAYRYKGDIAYVYLLKSDMHPDIILPPDDATEENFAVDLTGYPVISMIGSSSIRGRARKVHEENTHAIIIYTVTGLGRDVYVHWPNKFNASRVRLCKSCFLYNFDKEKSRLAPWEELAASIKSIYPHIDAKARYGKFEHWNEKDSSFFLVEEGAVLLSMQNKKCFIRNMDEAHKAIGSWSGNPVPEE